jgi:Mn-dependent DtxR family transcriptional regulator
MNNYHSEKKGVKRSSIEKVWNVLLEENGALTPSNISEKINLQVPSVRSCLIFLDKLGKVEIMTNGRTWLVKKKEECEVTNK